MAEEFKDIISTQSGQIEDVDNMAQVELEPVYGDAMRQMKKTAEVRDKMINKEIDDAKKKDGPVESKIKGTPEQRKMHLSESLFEDWDEEIKEETTDIEESINDSNNYESIVIVYKDDEEETIHPDYYTADAHFAELNDRTDDELAADDIIGFLQITTDEDGNKVLSAERVVGNDLNDTKRVEEVANKYLLSELRESNDKYEDAEYQFKIVLDVEPDSDLELQKLTHHMDYLVDTAEYDLVFSGVNVDKNIITGYVSGSDIDEFEDAIDISDWPEINRIESVEIEKENIESLTEARDNIESKLYDELSRIWAGRDANGKTRHAEVYSNPLGNGYKIETELKSVIDEASKIADKYNLPYTARKFRDYYLFTVDLPENESLDEGMSWDEIQAEINKDRQSRYNTRFRDYNNQPKRKEAELPSFVKNRERKEAQIPSFMNKK